MRWRELLDVARWAPSPHNIQPWRVRVLTDAEAELLYAPERLLPDTDPRGRFSAVGLGIFVETLRVAARAEGADVEAEYADVQLVARNGAAQRFARLRLVPFDGAEPLARELIERRRTSRIPYDGRPVEPAVLAELEAVARSYGHALRASSDPELVAWILELNRETLFHDLTDGRARREIGSWLRFSARDAERRRDGFSPAALGFPGWLLWLFFHARGLHDAPLLRPAVHALHARTTRGTRTVAWLDGPFERREEWIRAGELLARLWLTMTARGVQLHPFGSIITNTEANARLRERIGGDPWLIMRLGYSAEPPRSLRLETRELLVG